jgi:hypothetical protein
MKGSPANLEAASEQAAASRHRAARVIAFYLPQFHPIPENDAWWGRGFTEWTNVARAVPSFPGHQQPRRPADLGYYDLRVPEVREEQALLARRYGIHGFCFHYYWFNGRRLLERPLDEIFATGRPAFPFCICWANENWTRRWDGQESEVLLHQEHTADSDARFIEDVIPLFEDPRYIRYDGKPVLLVYRANILPEPRRTAEIWRERCLRHGLGDVHLVAAQTFGLGDPRPLGFDAAVEFPPHGIDARGVGHLEAATPGFAGKVFDYRTGVDYALGRPQEPYRLHRTVMTAWDNTPRRRLHAHVWHHASPDQYERWLRGAIEVSQQDPRDREPLVFVNAWNEWAEGAYLEPDESNGHAYLQATRRAILLATPGPIGAVESSGLASVDDAEALRAALARAEVELDAQRRANEWLRAELEAQEARTRGRVTYFTPDPPPWLPADEVPLLGTLQIERIAPLAEDGSLDGSRGRSLHVAGFALVEGVDPYAKDAAAFLVLRAPERGLHYFAPLTERTPRADVAEAIAGRPSSVTVASGFAVDVWYDGVEPGLYELAIVQRSDMRVVATFSGLRVRIPD